MWVFLSEEILVKLKKLQYQARNIRFIENEDYSKLNKATKPTIPKQRLYHKNTCKF